MIEEAIDYRGQFPRDRARPPRNFPKVTTFAAAVLLSGAAWILAAQGGRLGTAIAVALGVGPFILAALSALTGRRILALQYLAYAAAMQPAVRTYAGALPYLLGPYMLPVITVALLLRPGSKIRVLTPAVPYAIYLMLELAGSVAAESPAHAKTVLLPSFTVLLFILIASFQDLRGATLLRVLNAHIIGVLSVAALTVPAYLTGDITWGRSSNFDAAGGMGPNQLSLLFSGGAYLLYVLGLKSRHATRAVYWLCGFALTALMVLTFSRGGAYILGGALALHSLLSGRSLLRTTGTVAAYVIVASLVYVVAARITNGRVAERYSVLNTSNRAALARNGWRMFETSPWTGVGTGNFYILAEGEDYFGVRSGAHNEFIRSGAEHGVLGFVSWTAFVMLTLSAALRAKARDQRAFRASLVGIAIVSMLYNGLKLLSQPFFLFLALSARLDDFSES